MKIYSNPKHLKNYYRKHEIKNNNNKIYYSLHINTIQNEKIHSNINNNNNISFFKNYDKIKKVIYTANLGNYDKIKPIPKQEGWDCINIID